MITVALSVGQTKIGAGALDEVGNVICQVDEVATPPAQTARHQAIVDQVMRVVDQVGLPKVTRVGISYPEMMEPPARLISNPDALTAAPNPYREDILAQLGQRLNTAPTALPFAVEVLHDAAAAVLGEVSPKGTVAGCQDCVFIVWGTGVASGIVKDGSLYWQDSVVGLMTGEIGLQVIRTSHGEYEYRPSDTLPELHDGELRLDRRMRGPEVARRIRECANQERVGQEQVGQECASQGRVGQASPGNGEAGQTLASLLDKPVDEIDLIDVNRAARLGNPLAVQLIAQAGEEMGSALVPFISYWLAERKMAFARQIVIGSGVAKLGDGVGIEGNIDGENVLLTAIRSAAKSGLRQAGVAGYDPTGIVISKIDYEREYFGFL